MRRFLSKVSVGMGVAVALSVTLAGVAMAQNDCEKKCEETYKGMSWHIAQCKKRNQCTPAAATAPAPATAPAAATAPAPATAPAAAGAPAASSPCEQKCEQWNKGMPVLIEQCKRKQCTAEVVEKGVEKAPAFSTGTCQQKCEVAYHGMKWHVDKCKNENCKAEIADNQTSARSWETLLGEIQKSLAEVTAAHRRIGAVDCDYRAELKQQAMIHHRKAMQAVADAEHCKRARGADQLRACMNPYLAQAKGASAALQPMAAEMEGPCPRPGKPIIDPKKGTVYASQWEKIYTFDLLSRFNSIKHNIQRINSSGAFGSEKGGCIDVPPRLHQVFADAGGLMARATTQCSPLSGKAQVDCANPIYAALGAMVTEANALTESAIRKGDRVICKVGKSIVGGAEDAFRDIKNFLKGSIIGWILEKVGKAVLNYIGLDAVVDTAEKIAEAVGILKDLANKDASTLLAKGAELLEEKVSKWLTAKIMTLGPVQKLMSWIAGKGVAAAFKLIKFKLVLPVTGWICGLLAGTPLVWAIPFVPIVAERILNWAAEQLGEALGSAALKLEFVHEKVSKLLQPLIAKILGAARGAIVGLLQSKSATP